MGYVHVNQDTLGTRQKCLKAAEEALVAPKSCVIGTLCRSLPLSVGMNVNARQHQPEHRDEKVLRGSSQESWRARPVLRL